MMDLDRQVCDRARRSRDARFDGRFFIGVTSTGVYCRPICPAREPKQENVLYFRTAAAAEAAGFRPCLRCRPEASPGTPAWLGTSGLVSRALRLISEGVLDGHSVEDLADKLGVTARHLRRLFLQHLGATPLDVALTRRTHFAKRLIDETSLPLREVAFAAGFGSLRRFNDQIRRTYSRTPTDIRRRTRSHKPSSSETYRFRLAFRPPYDWESLLAFLKARATPGVEAVDDACYRRTITVDGKHGVIEVCRAAQGSALNLEVRFPDSRALLFIVERVRRMFDLAADPNAIAAQLSGDPLLRELLTEHPGIRMPGAWDGFELAVRAILGQQISVPAATTIAGRLASMYGSRSVERGTLNRLFPTPMQLANAPIERAGVIAARAGAIRGLARRVAEKTISFGPLINQDEMVAALRAVPGIGEWTTSYIAMRALGEPDAFPSGDLVLRRMAGVVSPGQLDVRAELWRPWRAYAVILLWQGATDGSGISKPTHSGPAMKARVLSESIDREARRMRG